MKTRLSRLALIQIAAVFLILALAPWGCGTPTQPHIPALPPVFAPGQRTFTDQEVLSAIYSSYQHPQGFYDEPRGPRDARPYYVNTNSVRRCTNTSCGIRELSTDDVEEAARWADSTIANSSGNPSPIDRDRVVVTERYIEFPRTDAGRDPAMRVHRLSYLDRTTVDLAKRDSVFGTFNARPIDPTTVRALCEYLWFKDQFSVKALSSYGEDRGATVVHTVFEVLLAGGDYGMHDEAILVRLEYRVSKETGLIVLRETVERRVQGRYHPNLTCGG